MSDVVLHSERSSRFARAPRLSALLFTTLLIAVCAVVAVRSAHRHRQMRQTVAELERLGAEFEYESFLPIRLHMVWGARISEHRFFQRLARVFAGEKFDDTHLAMLQHVRGLKSLYLDGTRVTNAGMKYVTKVTSLEELSLCFTAVDDNGLIHLKPLRHLRHLGLAYTDVGDAGVLQIRQFKDLETLWLHEDQVSETTLRTLERQLPKLEVSCVVE